MSSTPNCPRCGAPLASTASPQGLCAKCLLLAASEEVPGSEPRASETGSSSRPPTPEELAEHFSGLEILELVGQGGMGAVYKARQKGLDRVVALKILHSEVASAPGFSERFAREARTLAALQHENLVTVHEFGQAGPWCYLVMELVDGVDLRHLMAERAVAPREALSIVAQVCDALQYAHDQGVVHRDIKPENILVDRRGRVRILDFGLSKLVGARAGAVLTRVDQVMGTPHYMAPEQWEKPQTVDHRADIYSLGVVFYELLTGELPVGRFEPPSHRRVAVDVRLDDVVLRALERAPERRYQHASEVKSRVEEIGSSAAPSAAVPAATIAPTSERHRRVPHGVWWGCGCLALVALVLAVPFFLALFSFVGKPEVKSSDTPAGAEQVREPGQPQGQPGDR